MFNRTAEKSDKKILKKVKSFVITPIYDVYVNQL